MSEHTPRSEQPIWERKGMTEQEYLAKKGRQVGKIVRKLMDRYDELPESDDLEKILHAERYGGTEDYRLTTNRYRGRSLITTKRMGLGILQDTEHRDTVHYIDSNGNPTLQADTTHHVAKGRDPHAKTVKAKYGTEDAVTIAADTLQKFRSDIRNNPDLNHKSW